MVARRCFALVQLGDFAALLVWKGVLRAVQEIVRTERRVDEQMN
jgi:HAMP domain-containing protein